jgi:hypothetical protein
LAVKGFAINHFPQSSPTGGASFIRAIDRALLTVGLEKNRLNERPSFGTMCLLLSRSPEAASTSMNVIKTIAVGGGIGGPNCCSSWRLAEPGFLFARQDASHLRHHFGVRDSST